MPDLDSQLFPSKKAPHPPGIFSDERISLDDEVREFLRDFEGVPWLAVSAAAIQRNCDRVGFFTEDSYAYYLPAVLKFLSYAKQNELESAEMLLYGLLTRGIPRPQSAEYRFTPKQLQAIRDVFSELPASLPELQDVIKDVLREWFPGS